MSLADDLRNEARCVHPAAADAMRFAADELDRLASQTADAARIAQGASWMMDVLRSVTADRDRLAARLERVTQDSRDAAS